MSGHFLNFSKLKNVSIYSANTNGYQWVYKHKYDDYIKLFLLIGSAGKKTKKVT